MTLHQQEYEAISELSLNLVKAVLQVASPATAPITNGIFGFINSAIVGYFSIIHPSKCPDVKAVTDAINTVPN